MSGGVLWLRYANTGWVYAEFQAAGWKGGDTGKAIVPGQPPLKEWSPELTDEARIYFDGVLERVPGAEGG